MLNDNFNKSRKSYNNSNNLNYDLDAISFIPRNNNSINNNNVNNGNNINNSNNTNNFFSNKVRQSWICSFCHNSNYQGKKIFF